MRTTPMALTRMQSQLARTRVGVFFAGSWDTLASGRKRRMAKLCSKHSNRMAMTKLAAMMRTSWRDAQRTSRRCTAANAKSWASGKQWVHYNGATTQKLRKAAMAKLAARELPKTVGRRAADLLGGTGQKKLPTGHRHVANSIKSLHHCQREEQPTLTSPSITSWRSQWCSAHSEPFRFSWGSGNLPLAKMGWPIRTLVFAIDFLSSVGAEFVLA